jgi:tellurite resistance protein
MADNTNWEDRGQRAVGAAADLATGLFKGFRSIGTRIQAGRHQYVVDAFCACSGLVAAQNGRLKKDEIEGFRRFLLDNRQHPVIGHFDPDDLVRKFKDYAVQAFLEDDEVFTRVLDKVNRNSEEANLIITGCLIVVFADGHCDDQEQNQIEQLALKLGVDIQNLAQSAGVTMPPTSQQPASRPRASSMTRNLSSASPKPQNITPAAPQIAPKQTIQHQDSNKTECSFCKGKGCAFCA